MTLADTPPNVQPSTYRQAARGSLNAQAAGPHSSATVNVTNNTINLPPVKDADLAAAKALLEAMPVDQAAAIAPLPGGSTVPFGVNPQFVGREDELCQLAGMLKDWPGRGLPTVAICGIGGIGKSQLAVEFAHRCGQYFAGGVFWISLADPAAVEAEIAKAFATLPDLPQWSRHWI